MNKSNALTSIKNGLADIRLHLTIHHHDHNPPVVLPSSTGSAAHLDVFPGGDPSEVLAVEFGALREDHRLGGHVDT